MTVIYTPTRLARGWVSGFVRWTTDQAEAASPSAVVCVRTKPGLDSHQPQIRSLRELSPLWTNPSPANQETLAETIPRCRSLRSLRSNPHGPSFAGPVLCAASGAPKDRRHTRHPAKQTQTTPNSFGFVVVFVLVVLCLLSCLLLLVCVCCVFVSFFLCVCFFMEVV